MNFQSTSPLEQDMSNLQVIGAGLGRTGTLSLKTALEELGFSPCHHMIETMKQPDIQLISEALFNNQEDVSALNKMFSGYQATVDYPGCMFYEQFIKLNPDAKVVLSVRDSPESWVKSVRATIFRGFVSETTPKFLKILHQITIRVHGVDPNDLKTDLVEVYNEWNARVQRTVPNDNLLLFNVKEGWKPLCEFLGVPVPDKEFPKVNSTEFFQKIFRPQLDSFDARLKDDLSDKLINSTTAVHTEL